MAAVGIPVTFENVTENAKKWEWWFGENNYDDATSRKGTPYGLVDDFEKGKPLCPSKGLLRLFSAC